MRLGHYILEGKEIKEVDLMTWARWLEKPDRLLFQENVGEAFISTVFLGLDHNMLNDGPPLLFETMVFDSGTDEDGLYMRYATYDEAEAGHRNKVEGVKRRMLEKNNYF